MKNIKIDNLYDIEKISYELYVSRKYDNKLRSKKLINIIKSQLTKRQIHCMYLYYVKKEQMKNISQQLNISVTTVSRELNKVKSVIVEKMSSQR